MMVKKTILKRALEAGIPSNFMRDGEPERRLIFRECIMNIKIPVEAKASVSSTVREGGKLEDARLLIDDAIRGAWLIPVRDFSTGNIDSEFIVTELIREEKPGFEGYLFWIALQITLNWVSKRSARYRAYYRSLPGSEGWEHELFEMEIVHISEPGKERNLTKSSAILGFVLTVCSKVCQMALSYNQDHRAGLVMSAQDWVHQKRISPESLEATFIYDRQTRLRKPEIWNVFQDWTESTDFIPRQVGGTALDAWMLYIGFPLWYRDLILVLSQQDYVVKENIHNYETKTTELWVGKITEGFMMGNALTKSILHLMHEVHFGVVNALVQSFGIKVPTFADLISATPLGPPGEGQLKIPGRDIDNITRNE